MIKKSKNIEVAVRMRPLLDRYQDHQAWLADSKQKTICSIPLKNIGNISSMNISGDQSFLKRRGSKALQKTNLYEFSYDHVFPQECSNKQVYMECCHPILSQFLSGKSSSILMYGQTTSGKTHTMLGSLTEQGLIIYSLKDVFKKIKTQQEVFISYMEIYNEQVNDLLRSDGVNLRISDEEVKGLQEVRVKDGKQAIQLLNQGEKLRSYAERNFHDHSSRSHTIFQIKLVDRKDGKVVARNVLNLVDLAGSQRVGQQDSNDQTGYINKSLFVLSNVIHKLSQKKSGHIPFRDSKLTRVLSSSLTTSSYTMFICTISPAQINFNQTLSTLRFANQSRKVQLKCVQDTILLNQSSLIIQQRQITKLKQQNKSLRKNLWQKQKDCQKACSLSLVLSKLQCLISTQNKQNKSINNHKSTGKKPIQQNQTIQKLKSLYIQYQRNIQTLENQYVKAMVNLTAEQLQYDREYIHQCLQQAFNL